ncbi:MAG: FtsX-like permease family protein [Tissierellia bacterium]|nr:FtsX-like permease family protein [Tissierellia bacterium]
MRKVKNSKWISNISKSIMKANKKRNQILVIAIALTAFMLTSVFTVTGSMLAGIEKATMLQVGTDLHGGFKFLTKEQYEKLSQDEKISDLCYNIIVGQPRNEELREDYTEIRYTDDKYAKHSFSLPQVGRLPKKSNEIATCGNVLDKFGLPHELGQKIYLKIDNGINRYEGNFIVSGIWEKPAETLPNQIYVSKVFQESFSPVWENEKEMESFQKVNSYAGSINPGFNFKNAFNLRDKMEKLKIRLDFGPEINEGVNWAYSTSSIDPTSMVLMTFLLTMIMVSGYLIISNIFNISVTADIHHYGLLKTIGTTNRQLKKIVIRQAMMISTIAIPTGLVSGYLASMVIIPLIINNMIRIPVTMEFNLWFFVISGIFAWMTVRISCIKPCRIVRKISPVEAIRYTEYAYSIKKKKKRTYKVTPITMAWQNLGRNKKKTVSVIISMALSIIMLNLTVSLVASFDEDLYVSSFAKTDFTIGDATLFQKYSVAAEYEGISQSDIDYCKKMNGLEDIGAIYISAGFHKIDGFAQKKVENFYEQIKDEIHPEAVKELKTLIFDNHKIFSNVFGLDQMVYHQLEMDAGKLDWEKFKTGKYVIISAPIEGSKDDAGAAFYKIGDHVPVEMPNGTVQSYEVMGIGKVPYAMGPGYSRMVDINFILPSVEYLKHSKSQNGMKLFMNIDDAYMEEVETSLTEYCEKTKPLLDFESRSKYKEGFMELKQTFLLIGGAISFILALIGILNFINVTYTSIRERGKELKTLHAVGMTYKQIMKMLTTEGVIRIVFTILVAFTIGIGWNRIIINMIAGEMIMFKYQLVIWPMMVSIPLFLLIAVLVPKKIRWYEKTYMDKK